MGYLEKFQKLIEELQNHPKIDIVESRINRPATDSQIAQAEEKFKLTPKMLEFYKELNGLQVNWKLKDADPNRSPLGNIKILNVEVTFSDWADNVYFDSIEATHKFKPLHPLDNFVSEACAALYLDGSSDPKVYYHYYGEEMSSMEVNFEGYLDLLLKSRGFWYWQRAIAKPNNPSPDFVTSAEQEFRTMMPQLFSDFSNDDFKRIDGHVWK